MTWFICSNVFLGIDLWFTELQTCNSGFCFTAFFQSSTATTLTLELFDPVKSNGRIEVFNIYVDGILVIVSTVAHIFLIYSN